MSLFYEDINLYQTTLSAFQVAVPGGTVDGDAVVIIQGAGQTSSFDTPAGFREIVQGDTSGEISVCWGIRGQDFTGNTIDLTRSTSSVVVVGVLRVSGDIDDTCEFTYLSENFTTGERPSFTSPDLDVSAWPNRPKLRFNFGSQRKSEHIWTSYSSAGDFDNTLIVNFVSPGTGDTCCYGLAVNEDNESADDEVRGGNFGIYQSGGFQGDWRGGTATFAMIGPVKTQTDLLSPTVVF